MVSEAMLKVTKSYEEIVSAMDDPEIVQTAMKLAYYSAMFDAALHDPLDDPADQEQIIAIYGEEIDKYIGIFQELVNEKL